MATAIYQIELSDSPNTGRDKINTTFTNLKTTADNTAALLTGIGDVVGTTNTKTLTNKTLVSDSLGGGTGNNITINRLDIDGYLFKVTADTGYFNVDVDGVSLEDVQILGNNGIETRVSSGTLIIENPTDLIINEANQTFTVAASGVTSGYTADINGHALVRGRLAVGAHSSLYTENLHISETNNSSPVSAVIKNLGSAGSILKLISSSDNDYWFAKRTASDHFILGHRQSGDSIDGAVIYMDSNADTNSVYIAASGYTGVNCTNPLYPLQIASGIGISENILYMASESTIQHSVGSIRTIISGQTLIDANANGKVGIGGLADASYNLKVTGDVLVSNDTTVTNDLTVNGISYLEGGISIQTDKFTVDTSGNVVADGDLTIGGTATVGSLSLTTGLTLSGTTVSKFDIIQPAVASGITFRNYAGTDSMWFTGDGYFHVGQGFPSGVTDRFAVNGSVSLHNSSSDDNYFKIYSNNTANYLQTLATTTDQKALYLQVAGTGSAAKQFYIQNGTSDSPGSLTTKFLIDENGYTSINTEDVAGNGGHDIFAIYNGSSKPFVFRSDGDAWMGINAHYSSGWKYTKTMAGSYVGAAAIGVDNTGATGYFVIRTAAAGSANGTISWPTNPAIKIDHLGNIGIQTTPDTSYDLKVAGDFYAANVETGSDLTVAGTLTSAAIALTSTATTSVNSAGGAVFANTVKISDASNDVALRIDGDGSNPTPYMLFTSNGTTQSGKIQGATEPDGTARRLELSGGTSNGYAYSDYFKAGEAFYAGHKPQYDGSYADPVWCPVPFVVFCTDRSASTDNVLTSDYEVDVRIPRAGLYKLTWTYQFTIPAGNKSDPSYVSVKAELDSTELYVHTHQWDIRGDGGSATFDRVSISNSVMCFQQLGKDDSSKLKFSKVNNKGVNAYYIKAVCLEWIADTEFNAHA